MARGDPAHTLMRLMRVQPWVLGLGVARWVHWQENILLDGRNSSQTPQCWHQRGW